MPALARSLFFITFNSKYFKVVQGHVLLLYQRTRDPLAIAGFLVRL